jgi:hypothetical protein
MIQKAIGRKRKVTGIWINPKNKKVKINYIETGKTDAYGTAQPYSKLELLTVQWQVPFCRTRTNIRGTSRFVNGKVQTSITG